MCEAGSASLLPPTGLDTRHRRLANAHVVPMCYVPPVPSPAPEYTMSTTTIRLPDELQARIAEAAKRDGTTSHNFIPEAIPEKAELAPRTADFDPVSKHRSARLLETRPEMRPVGKTCENKRNTR